jgi:hypothetical protein
MLLRRINSAAVAAPAAAAVVVDEWAAAAARFPLVDAAVQSAELRRRVAATMMSGAPVHMAWLLL